MHYFGFFLSNAYQATNTNSSISCLFQVQMRHALCHIINFLLTSQEISDLGLFVQTSVYTKRPNTRLVRSLIIVQFLLPAEW